MSANEHSGSSNNNGGISPPIHSSRASPPIHSSLASPTQSPPTSPTQSPPPSPTQSSRAWGPTQSPQRSPIQSSLPWPTLAVQPWPTQAPQPRPTQEPQPGSTVIIPNMSLHCAKDSTGLDRLSVPITLPSPRSLSPSPVHPSLGDYSILTNPNTSTSLFKTPTRPSMVTPEVSLASDSKSLSTPLVKKQVGMGSGGPSSVKKRGRPPGSVNKNKMPQASGSKSLSPAVKQQVGMVSGGSSSMKKRGRPPGSLNKNKTPQASRGPSLPLISGICDRFVAHLIRVQAGEDISSKIVSAATEDGLQALCIITAMGPVSNVTLVQNSSTPNVSVSHEGRFEIVTLSGSYVVSEIGGEPKINGGLSIQCTASNGDVLAGRIQGPLIAASEVQVVIGCFTLGTWKKQSKAGGSSTSESRNGCSGGGPGSSHNQTHGGGEGGGGGSIGGAPAVVLE